ncbi:MAG TPA: 50S ribosomal protein L18, partial [Chromatiaceae bacterium]|nr:50S ribosomal protein L18 [Chromatiaceae bacterium]
MDKKASRIRRSRRTRAKIRELGSPRLCVFRSSKHIYAQVIDPAGEQVLASASSLDKAVRDQISGYTGNKDAAGVVGKIVAERAKAAGVETVAFDRSGFKYRAGYQRNRG